MSSFSAEPISPELVLVCPELREQALAEQPQLPWQVVTAAVPMRTPPDSAVGWISEAAADGVAALLQIARLATVVVVVCIVLTLILTLVADMLR